MPAHDNLDKAVSLARGQRVKPGHGAALRNNAQQVARPEGAQAAPRKALPKADLRQCKAQDRRGGLNRLAIILAGQKAQLGAVWCCGLIGNVQRQADQLAKGAGPAGKGLRRLLVDPVQGQGRGPTCSLCCRLHRFGKGAEPGKAAVAEAQNNHRHPAARGRRCDPLQRATGRGRGIAVAPGCREDDQALGTGIALGRKGRQGGQVNFLAMSLQGAGQSIGKAPGAAAFTAHQNDRSGGRGRHHSGQARPAAAIAPPDQAAGHGQHRHGQCRKAQNQAPQRRAIAGVEQIDPLSRSGPGPRCLPDQQRARALIDIAGAGPGGQGEDIGGIPGIGEGQIAQVGHRHGLQGGHV